MKALVYTAPKKFQVKDIDYPRLRENQVIIKVKACGVCKTDLHIHNGEFLAEFPLTPGHEFAGEIEEIGSKVTAFSKGERVVADNTVLCGECYYCRRNQPLFCENFYSLGCNGPGGFAQYVVVNQDKVFPIKKLSFEEATLTEPTACAIHGMDVINARPGDDVLLFGAGPTGIILAQLLKYNGAVNLVVAAPTKFKLDIVKELCADYVIKVDRNDYTEHTHKIKQLFPKGFDIVVDATGAPSITEHTLQFAKYGGKIVVYGVCAENERISISPYEVFRKELKIMGSFAQTHCFDRALKYLENGVVKVKKLITHSFKLEDYARALELVKSGKCLKVIIKPNE